MIQSGCGAIDVGGKSMQEAKLAHGGTRALPILLVIEHLGESRVALGNVAPHFSEQCLQLRVVARGPCLFDGFPALELFLEEFEGQRVVGFRRRVDALQGQQVLSALTGSRSVR